MAREIITRILCDVCLHVPEGEEPIMTDAKEMPPITIGALKPRILALCEVHQKDVFDPIKELVGQLGVVATDIVSSSSRKAQESAGVFACFDPTCSKHDEPFSHKQSLRNHIRAVHGSTITAMRAQYSNDEQLQLEVEAREAKPPAVLRAECDQKGCKTVYEWPESKRPAVALGVHKAKTHGIRGTKHDKKGKQR